MIKRHEPTEGQSFLKSFLSFDWKAAVLIVPILFYGAGLYFDRCYVTKEDYRQDRVEFKDDMKELKRDMKRILARDSLNYFGDSQDKKHKHP